METNEGSYENKIKTYKEKESKFLSPQQKRSEINPFAQQRREAREAAAIQRLAPAGGNVLQ